MMSGSVEPGKRTTPVRQSVGRLDAEGVGRAEGTFCEHSHHVKSRLSMVSKGGWSQRKARRLCGSSYGGGVKLGGAWMLLQECARLRCRDDGEQQLQQSMAPWFAPCSPHLSLCTSVAARAQAEPPLCTSMATQARTLELDLMLDQQQAIASLTRTLQLSSSRQVSHKRAPPGLSSNR